MIKLIMLQKSGMRGTFKRTASSINWILKLYWQMSPRNTLLSIFLAVGTEVTNIVNTFILAKGIDLLLAISRGESETATIYLIVFAFFVMAVVQQGLGIFSNYIQRSLSLMFPSRFAEITYGKLHRLGMDTLENPEVNNLVERMRRDSGRFERQFEEVVSLVGLISGVIGSGAIIFGFAPHFILVFVLILLPSSLLDRKYLSRLWKYNRDITEEQRKAYDSAFFLIDSRSLQELRITRGYKYLSNHFESFIGKWLTGLNKMRATWFRNLFGLRIVRSLGEAYADFYVFLRFIAGAITIGDVTFYIRQVANFTSSLGRVASSINNIYEGSLSIQESQDLFDLPEEEDGAEPFEGLLEGPEIEFKNVMFTYPRSKRRVINDLSLSIKKGEKIAIVGQNGAGKTTLIKLLLRFYKPQSGKVFVNSKDLNKIRIRDYYENVGVLFQDFNTYPNLSLRENIRIGKDSGHSKKDLRLASVHADVSDFVKEYEHGYEQLLSEKYKGGIRPSTGQWQKIAIARFFYRNSPLVIFDEPTAAIDAKSEAKIFNKIYSFFKSKTVIIISHRFSTVRNADRIVVISRGRIIEQGSHEELMKHKGRYAEAFKLQAEGYRE